MTQNKSSSGIVNPLVLALIVVIAVISFYYVFNHSSDVNRQEVPEMSEELGKSATKKEKTYVEPDYYNKVNIPTSEPVTIELTNIYTSKYGYSIRYPDSWSAEEDLVEGTTNLALKKEAANESHLRMFIGDGRVFSSSGALCANQGCDYEAGKAMFTLKGVQIPEDITGLYVFDRDEKVWQFQTFRTYTEFGEFDVENFSPGVSLGIIVQFTTAEEGDEILEILKSLDW